MNDVSVTRTRGLLVLLACALSFACLTTLANGGTAEAADPVFNIDSYTASPSLTQAGGHPDIEFRLEVDSRVDPDLKDECGCNDLKDLTVNLPEGLIGNPHATPQCAIVEFAGNLCAPDSQIGLAKVLTCVGSFCFEFTTLPLYNLIPKPDQAGLAGFKTPFIDTPVFTELTARTESDYGLVATTSGISHVLPIKIVAQKLWGVPADPSNDDERFLTVQSGGGQGAPTPSNSPRIPFMQNPTTCGKAIETTAEALAYNRARDTVSAVWPATTGCSQLAFNPSLVAKPTTTAADTPSGLDVDLTVPQNLSPTTPSPSEIRDTTVTLPEGMVINPNAADGKLSCTDEQARFGTRLEAQCPEFAKVGTLTVESSVLPGDLLGALYIGEPKPGDRYRLVLVADGFGLHVKLPGTVTADPKTGRLVSSFKDLPQFPFERFNLHLFGSDRGLLATPTRCGSYAVESTFVPWNAESPTQKATQFFSIDSGPNGGPCPGSARPFSPSWQAASVGNTPGAHTPFQVRISRSDGDQYMTGLDVTTPPGFSAKLAGIPYCSEAALALLADPLYPGINEMATPACSAASQIGTSVAASGSGVAPVHTRGKVYLAGPYKGAPLSLVSVIPAVSGPFDLGNVAVRAAIRVDPVTAQVTTVSDPLPLFVEGIPVKVRSLNVSLDRPDFALTPTSCGPHSVDATISGDEGAQAIRAAHYQMANCGIMPFGPKLTLRLSGGVRRRGHPAVRAVVTAGPGEANIRATRVTLPAGELLDNAHIGTVCTRVQFAADACPADSVYGHAEAITPLLDAPLKGNVYLRSSSNRLPDLVADLKGQVDVELAGRVDSVDGRLRATFANVPDAPISRFTLNLRGGSKGLLINSESLCGTSKKATVRMTGHSEAVLKRRIRLQVACGKNARTRRSNPKAGR